MPSEAATTERSATRDKLLSFARREFEANGYDAATVAAIVEAAGVSRGTFYLYFESKEDVFRTLVDQMHAEILRAQEWPKDVPRDEVIRRSIERFLEFYRDNAHLMAVLEQAATHTVEFRQVRLAMRRGVTRRGERFIRQAQVEGLAPEGIDPHYAALALNGMVDRFAYMWFVLEEDIELGPAVDTLTELWLRSIGFDLAASVELTARTG